jgi:hypothetical protein
MNARNLHLKIKIQTLADEARHIRRDERKALSRARYLNKKGSEKTLAAYRVYEDLNDHRRGVVRDAARHNQLAYGCLRGTPYEKIERYCEEAPNWGEVRKIAIRFGGDPEKVDAWITAAKNHIQNMRRAA